MDGENTMKAKNFVLLVVLVIACGLLVASVWNAPVFTGLILFAMDLWNNKGATIRTVIKWPACWGMIGAVLFALVLRFYFQPSRQQSHQHTLSLTPPPTLKRHEPQVIIIKPVGFPVQTPAQVETIEYLPFKLPTELSPKLISRLQTTGYNTWVKWRKVYVIAAPLKLQGELTEKEILAHVHEHIDNLKTLREIDILGKAGYLDTWENFCEMIGKKGK